MAKRLREGFVRSRGGVDVTAVGRGSDAFCQALMAEICRCMEIYAQGKADLLRYGARTPVQKDSGRNLLKVREGGLTEEQIAALQGEFRDLQADILGRLFSLIDGSSQPEGWPAHLRLVDVDTGEQICPERLQWSFGRALVRRRMARATVPESA